MNETVNPIDALLDPNNSDNIVLYDEKDNGIEFKQICLVPIRKQIYCILKPVKKINGLGDNEALVFQIYTDKIREDSLIFIDDQKIIDEVFEEYYRLFNNKK